MLAVVRVHKLTNLTAYRNPALQKRAAFAEEVNADLEQFEKLQAVVNEYLRHHPSGPVCDMYR